MPNERTVTPVREATLRLWPAVAIVALQWLVRFVAPAIAPDAAIFGAPLAMLAVLGGVAGGVAIVAWWLFFSRAPWFDRAFGMGMMVVAIVASSLIAHESISNGMMGMMLPIFAIPLVSLALVAAAAAGRGAAAGRRRALMAAALLVASGSMALVRTSGVTGDGSSDLHWRWTESPEERLLARGEDVLLVDANASAQAAPEAATPAAPPSPAQGETPKAVADSATPIERTSSIPASPADSVEDAATDASASATGALDVSRGEWPGFRGPARDGVVHGVRIDTNWSSRPPRELWRRPVGPGWSSFAVHGDRIYTQEQRGDDEIVSCYTLSTGEPVWRHQDPVRFWESNGGAGPRATPTLHDGYVYTMGATGLVNVLNAENGTVVWSRDAAKDIGSQVPDWGFAGSPLVIDDLVIVALSGQLVAYDARTGDRRWLAQPGGGGYSSPHLAMIAGVPQVLLMRGARTLSVAPADGSLLWEHSSGQPAVSIVQPAQAADGDLLIAAGDAMGGAGIRRVMVAQQADRWTVEERWASRGLKPYFNDFVVHEGHAYGFDGSILACIDLENGERAWKGGRYGHGQLVLLPEQDVLLLLSEEGELALVAATADQFKELARIPAIEGKTWNHPVLAGDVLLVRNGQEMAAFKIALAEPDASSLAR